MQRSITVSNAMAASNSSQSGYASGGDISAARTSTPIGQINLRASSAAIESTSSMPRYWQAFDRKFSCIYSCATRLWWRLWISSPDFSFEDIMLGLSQSADVSPNMFIVLSILIIFCRMRLCILDLPPHAWCQYVACQYAGLALVDKLHSTFLPSYVSTVLRISVSFQRSLRSCSIRVRCIL